MLGEYSFLLTFFFFWASVHVTHQAQWISETYRRKAAGRVSNLDRLLDGAVILGALYTVATFKFVEGRFALGSNTLLFPDFLKHRWVAVAFAVGFLILYQVLSSDIARQLSEYATLKALGYKTRRL